MQRREHKTACQIQLSKPLLVRSTMQLASGEPCTFMYFQNLQATQLHKQHDHERHCVWCSCPCTSAPSYLKSDSVGRRCFQDTAHIMECWVLECYGILCFFPSCSCCCTATCMCNHGSHGLCFLVDFILCRWYICCWILVMWCDHFDVQMAGNVLWVSLSSEWTWQYDTWAPLLQR